MSRVSGGRKKRFRDEPEAPGPSQKATRKKSCKGKAEGSWSACKRCGGCKRALKDSTGRMCFCCSKPLCIDCGRKVKHGLVCLDECYERWFLAANVPDWQAWGEWEFMDDDSLDRLVKLLTIFEKPPFRMDPESFAHDPLSRSNFSFLFTEKTQVEENGGVPGWEKATVGCIVRILGPGVAELSHIQRDVECGLPGGGKRALMDLVARIHTWNREGSLDIKKFFIPATDDAVDKFWMRIDGMEKMTATEVEEMFDSYRLSVDHDHEFRCMTTWLKWEPFDDVKRSSTPTGVPVEKQRAAEDVDAQGSTTVLFERPCANTIDGHPTPRVSTHETTKLDEIARRETGISEDLLTRTPYRSMWEAPQSLEPTPYNEDVATCEMAGRATPVVSGDRPTWKEHGFCEEFSPELSEDVSTTGSYSDNDELSIWSNQNGGLDGSGGVPHKSSGVEEAGGESVVPTEAGGEAFNDQSPRGDTGGTNGAADTGVSSLFFDLC